ncbi:DUF2147 domain-containing protein [Parasulfitobacter algicola]|uniref:DUF2147 domain-containing protein n=1 Tax=Parasulfitobacter algicola TaxID=2614809 RepID=A0ABX2IQR8_9RHOB|nr:DUF2147 domain-containing protein [Sulfitobacter algicola]NSX55219.1 DUF2147 domain-containing protein [Sulfitobacter algicola]
MKKYLAIAVLLIATAGTAMANSPTGIWQLHRSKTNGIDHLNVQFGACGNAVCARIIEAIGVNGRPVASYPHVGKTIIRNMVHQGGGKYAGGTIWDPRRDKTFALEMQVRGGRIRAEACANAVLCRSFRWSRIR